MVTCHFFAITNPYMGNCVVETCVTMAVDVPDGKLERS
jgi:hypothetical protein